MKSSVLHLIDWWLGLFAPSFGGGGGGSQSSQTVQNFSPEEAAARNKVQTEAERVYDSTKEQITNSPYPGPVPTGPSTPTTEGQQYYLNLAHSMQPYIDQLGRAQTFGLEGALDVDNNPYLQKAIAGAQRSVTQQYMDPGGVMAGLRADAGNAGQYGGSRQGLAQGVAAGRYLDTIGDIATDMSSDAYSKGLDTFSRTLLTSPQTFQTALTPGNMLSAVGQQQEGYTQQQNEFEAAMREWGMNAPWSALQNYANIVFGGSAPGTTTTTTGGGSSRAMTALGGAAMGASLAPMLGLTGPVGAGIGLMLSLFS